MCAYLLSEDKGCRATCDREALAQASFRSRSRCSNLIVRVAGTAAGGKLGEGLLEISALERKK